MVFLGAKILLHLIANPNLSHKKMKFESNIVNKIAIEQIKKYLKTQILILIIGNFSYSHVYSYRSSRSEVFCKKVFLEISQNLQENTCARVSFSIKLHCENFLQIFLSIIIYFQLSGKKSQFTKNFACPLILLSSKLKIRIKFSTR